MKRSVIRHVTGQGVARVLFGILLTFSAATCAWADNLQRSANTMANVKGVEFRIPNQFLAKPFGVDKFGILLFLPLPDTDHAKTGTNGEAVDNRKPAERTILVNVDAKWPGPRALSMHYTITKSIYGPYEKPEPGPFDLVIERAIPPDVRTINWQGEDLYTSGSPDHPATYVSINCRSDLLTGGPANAQSTDVISGACSMGFLYKEFLADVTFPKYRLAEWKVIKIYTTAWLDSFVVSETRPDDSQKPADMK